MAQVWPKASSAAASFSNQNGFTIVELMVVIGVMAILISLAMPVYLRCQRQARQAEAKHALSAIFGLEKAFYVEYASYAPSFEAIGFMPEGGRRFYQVQACGSASTAPWDGKVKGYAGGTGAQWYDFLNSPYSNSGYQPDAAHPCASIVCTSYGDNPQTFEANAWGNLYENAARSDVWLMDQDKNLSNCASGL